jgi:hypothetical protein
MRVVVFGFYQLLYYKSPILAKVLIDRKTLKESQLPLSAGSFFDDSGEEPRDSQAFEERIN